MQFEIGQDTVIMTDDRFTLISVHNSNDRVNFVKQWTMIRNVIDNNKERTLIICGDFNAKLIQKTKKSFYFVDKEDYEEVIFDVNLDRNVKVTEFESTTAKVRCLTAQFKKMLSQAFSSIDGFVIVSPVGSKEDIVEGAFSGYIEDPVFLDSTHKVVYPPLSWPSDHAMIYLRTKFGGIFSMNAFGESVTDSLPLNIFEIFTKKCLETYQTNSDVRDEFSKIKNEFLNRPYTIIGSKTTTTIGRLAKEKHFSKMSRKYAIAGSIFRPPRDFDKRRDQTEFYNELCSKYNLEYNKFIEDLRAKKEKVEKERSDFYNFHGKFENCDTDEEKEEYLDLEDKLETKLNEIKEIFQVVQTITGVYQEFMTSEKLEEFFNEWYLELETTQKMDIMDVVTGVMENQELNPEYLCLQEVSEGMLEIFKSNKKEIEDRYRYTFDVPDQFVIGGLKDGKINKTRGVIFYRMR